MSNEQERVTEEKQIKKVWYAFCRIPNGIKISYLIDDQKKHIILKSGIKKTIAPDKTVTFSQSHDYGITELTQEQMEICKKDIERTGIYKKGYVFFAESVDTGTKKAKECLKLYKTTGFERLTVEDVEKMITQFTNKD
jgi:hypothetical protein